MFLPLPAKKASGIIITPYLLMMATSLQQPLSSVPKAATFPGSQLSPCPQERDREMTKRLSPRWPFSRSSGEVLLYFFLSFAVNHLKTLCSQTFFISLEGSICRIQQYYNSISTSKW